MLALTTNVVPFAGAVIEPLMVVVDDVRDRRAHRAQVVLWSISEQVGGPERLGARLSESPQHETQFVEAVEEAIRTGSEAKRRLLVAAVSNSIEHEELFDESQLIIDALAQLDVMHIRALTRLGVELAADGTWAKPIRIGEDGSVDPEDERRGRGISPTWRQLPAPIQAALVRAGVCSLQSPSFLTPSSAPSPSEGINAFGRDLLVRLRGEIQEEAQG